MEVQILVKNVKARCFWTLQISNAWQTVPKMWNTMQILKFKIIILANFVVWVSHLVINALILLHVFYAQIIYFCQFQVISVWLIVLPVTLFYFLLLDSKFKYWIKINMRLLIKN